MTNVAYIYQPHFKTLMFRVATNKQQSNEYNYIVVTCSPQYNGVWRYSGSLHETCGRWINGKTTCYEIPISSCEFIKSLDEVQQPDRRKKIIQQQKEWMNNQIKNRDYVYKNNPDWVVKELLE